MKLNKTQNQILEVIADNPGIDCTGISSELEREGNKITYDTLARHLKGLIDNNILRRIGKKPEEPEYYHAWVYHYYLNNEGTIK